MAALILNLVLATWLFVSAFVLPHSTTTSWNSLIVSVLVAAIAFLAFAAPGRPGIRYVNTVLAFWLMGAVFVLPHTSGGTVFNDVFVSLGLALVSLIPPLHRRRAEPPDRTAPVPG